MRPRLRSVSPQLVQRDGLPFWLLQDPWHLGDEKVLIPPALAAVLALCDGTRTPDEIRSEAHERTGAAIPRQAIDTALEALDRNCLLENERSARAIAAARAAYRAQSFRPAALASDAYPANVDELRQKLGHYVSARHDGELPAWNGRGIVSPHIDYQRGGPVYARVWEASVPAVLEADLVVILGTDHNGGLGTTTLTPLPFETPFGVLPADGELVDRLAKAIGEEAAFAEELNHIREHSIELSAIWLHFLFDHFKVKPCPMVPVLVGSFQHFVDNGSHPTYDNQLNAFVSVIRQEMKQRQVLVVASVDLAHVGPEFGDVLPVESWWRTLLQVQDQYLINSLLAGRADEFYGQIAGVRDRNRICGFSPLYLQSRILGQSSGREVAYRQCPADARNHSVVTICGLLLD